MKDKGYKVVEDWELEFIKGREQEFCLISKDKRQEELRKNMEKYKQKYGKYPERENGEHIQINR